MKRYPLQENSLNKAYEINEVKQKLKVMLMENEMICKENLVLQDFIA